MNSTPSLSTFAIASLLGSLLIGCAAPRAMVRSGRVTPHKGVRVGVNYSGNFASQTATLMFVWV